MAWYAKRPVATQKLGTLTGSGETDRGFIAHVTGSPAAAASDSVMSAVALTAAAQTGITAGITDPDMPRCVSITGGQAGQNGVVTVHGTNVANEVISDAITSNGTNTVAGTKAFKNITSIDLPGWTTDGSDTIEVGLTDKVGLYHCLDHDTVIRTLLNKTVEGTAPTVTADASDIEKNVADPNSALDGNQLDIYYIA